MYTVSDKSPCRHCEHQVDVMARNEREQWEGQPELKWEKAYQNPRLNNLKRDNEKCYKCGDKWIPGHIWLGGKGSNQLMEGEENYTEVKDPGIGRSIGRKGVRGAQSGGTWQRLWVYSSLSVWKLSTSCYRSKAQR